MGVDHMLLVTNRCQTMADHMLLVINRCPTMVDHILLVTNRCPTMVDHMLLVILLAVKKSSSNSESNDDQMPVVAPTPPPPCSDVSVVVTTDDNPTQNYYTVISSLGKEVMSGNGFTESGKTYTLTKCLPYGDYLFTMYDTAGNGMCCTSLRPGGYNLYANEVLLKAGGVFLFSDTTPLKTHGGDSDDDQMPAPPPSDDDQVPATPKPTPAPVTDDDDAKPVKPPVNND